MLKTNKQKKKPPRRKGISTGGFGKNGSVHATGGNKIPTLHLIKDKFTKGKGSYART